MELHNVTAAVLIAHHALAQERMIVFNVLADFKQLKTVVYAKKDINTSL